MYTVYQYIKYAGVDQETNYVIKRRNKLNKKRLYV